jgi:hypothetical protein
MVEEEAVDHPIPDVPVSMTILVVSVAVVFTVWVPVIMYRAAIRHGRSTRESLRLAGALMRTLVRPVGGIHPGGGFSRWSGLGHRGWCTCSSR